MNKKSPGPARTARTQVNIARVRESLIRSPERAARRHAIELGLSRESVKIILQKDLRFHPYKMIVVQQVNLTRTTGGLCCANARYLGRQCCNHNERRSPFFFEWHRSRQDLRYWALDNPSKIHKRPLHSTCITMWCAVAPFGIIGLYFFEENNVTVTVNSKRYIHMLNNFL